MSRNNRHPTSSRDRDGNLIPLHIPPPGPEDQAMGDEVQEGYASSTPTSSLTWIAWFCSLPGHEYFCEVTEDFIEDDFNLTGLSAMVPFWKEAMEMVLDVEPEDTHRIPDVSIVEASAELLYGLVHQRYILTRPGLQSMAEKYEAGVFGSCLRVYCTSTRLIPCGRSDMPGVDTVKLFCPNCNDIYTPSSSRFSGVDGAFFGTTFAHLFFHTYREYCPAPFTPGRRTTAASPNQLSSTSGSGPNIPPVNPNQWGGQKRPESRVYTPKIYGFKVSERAKSGPRMAWLRMRPPTFEDLNSVDSRGRWIDEPGSDIDDDKNGPSGGRQGRFDEDDDNDEPIEEDEEEEEDNQPQGPGGWVAGASSGPAIGPGRRTGGAGGRTRALKHSVRKRKRYVRPQQNDPSSSSEDGESSEQERVGLLETAEESALDTPTEEGFLSSEPSQPSGTSPQEGGRRRKKPELAAVKLANFIGKDLREMFSGIHNRAISPVDAKLELVKDNGLAGDVDAIALTTSTLVI